MDKLARRQLIATLERQINDTACLPELGPVQFMVLIAIRKLTPMATVGTVIDLVYKENGDILDVAHVFQMMQAFSTAKDPLIRSTGKITTTPGHRPSNSFGITDEGKEAITRTKNHLLRLIDFQEKQAIGAHHRMVAKKIQQPSKKKPVTANTSPASSGR